ncbi:hypothetical protein M433DRAFT_70123 [Acidomyces richmondensis BFW]|nr:MAG: hypothetical protein FE78DRAFT_136306 [Acidomyces sp. 'richmondensis']KYG44126.1 hypothetical protein M433DRAFT_70123 [Acidomyces richmondensis BFW]
MLTNDIEIEDRPPPKDLSHHLSRSTKLRTASSVKQFYKYFTIPGIGQLAGGLPNNSYFPFDTLEARVARPSRWQPTPNKPVDPPPEDEEAQATLSSLTLDGKNGPLNKPQDAITVPHTSNQSDPVKKIDLDSALQYGTAQGYPPLYTFIREFTRRNMHPNCPYKGGPEVILTCGNTDGFSKVLQALVNDWSEEKDWIREREGILVESFCYMNAIQGAKPRGLNIVPVGLDDEGMRADGPGGLKEVLENWDFKKGKRPHLMYTVTMGQNPTSGVLSLQRRRDIYALCSKYDVIIVEDDPYWYLQYPTSTASGGYDFLDSLVPSFVSVDTDGRVIRLDTFSKTVAPGCRLGWITAQPDLVERILRITETSTQQPSGFVQSMIAELILGPECPRLKDANTAKSGKGGLHDSDGWKANGWVRWLEGLRGNYERRMTKMCQILDSNKYLVKTGRRNSLADTIGEDEGGESWAVVEKTQLYSFDWPVGGMFVWLKVHFESHPLYPTYKKANELDRLSRALWFWWTTDPYLILVSPGTMFSPTDEIREKEGWKYFRLCFAAIDEDALAPTSKRLADGVAAFWRIKDKNTIEKLLEEDGSVVETRAGLARMAQMIGPC